MPENQCSITMQFKHLYTYFSFLTLLPFLPYPMPYMVVLSCTPVSSFWNIKNWLYSAVEYLKTLILIIAPVNFMEILIIVTVYLHAGIPWQDIASLLLFLLFLVLLLFILPQIFCSRRASFSGIYLNRGSQLVNAVVILS